MEALKELLGQIKIFARFDVAVCDKLEDLEKRIYALEENRKLKDQAILSLEKRYSEMLLIVKDLKRSI